MGAFIRHAQDGTATTRRQIFHCLSPTPAVALSHRSNQQLQGGIISNLPSRALSQNNLSKNGYASKCWPAEASWSQLTLCEGRDLRAHRNVQVGQNRLSVRKDTVSFDETMGERGCRVA